MSDKSKDQSQEDADKVTGFTIVQSVLAGFMGVQSNERRERDFKSGKFWHFFIAGLLFTILFVIGVAVYVNSLLASS